MKIDQDRKAGSTAGAMLLIVGCCIGAGMLGLPVISALAGFGPSLVMFLLSWLFMTSTALLLLEVNLWFSEEVSLISMAGRTLGIAGKAISWGCFLFLFYALGVAYIAGSGKLVSSFFEQVAGISIPVWVGSAGISLLFGLCVYLGTKAVDFFNRLLIAGLICSYVLLVALGAPHVHTEFLEYHNWSLAPFVLPVMIISFGFHNLIPSLSTYLRWDARKMRLVIIGGSALALAIYLIWEWLILGLVSPQVHSNLHQVLDEGEMATQFLKDAVGTSWVVNMAQYFAFFAIVTSFLGNSLSFVDFLADGLSIKKEGMRKALLCLLVIAPPFLFSLVYPHVFLMAINMAGAFGAVILFGILPAMMAWSGRYCIKSGQRQLLPGGKVTLAVIILFALWLMLMQFTDVWAN